MNPGVDKNNCVALTWVDPATNTRHLEFVEHGNYPDIIRRWRDRHGHQVDAPVIVEAFSTSGLHTNATAKWKVSPAEVPAIPPPTIKVIY